MAKINKMMFFIGIIFWIVPASATDAGKFLVENKSLFSELSNGSKILDNFDKAEGKPFKCPWEKLSSPGGETTYGTTECFALYTIALDERNLGFVFKSQDEITPFLYKMVVLDKQNSASPDYTLAYEVRDPEGGGASKSD